MSDIPAARAALRQVAQDLRAIRHDAEADLILGIVDAMLYREAPSRRRAPIQSVPATPGLLATLRQVAEANPQVTLQAIAHHAGVNAGRVSEALREVAA